MYTHTQTHRKESMSDSETNEEPWTFDDVKLLDKMSEIELNRPLKELAEAKQIKQGYGDDIRYEIHEYLCTYVCVND
jgi:hypothetical protein